MPTLKRWNEGTQQWDYIGIGVSGYSGISGYSGYSGISGYSGKSGYSGTNGSNGSTGTSGYSGYSGTNGTIGSDGASGYSGKSGYSGAFTTNSNAQVNSLGVGTAASGTTGEIRATNNITAYYSDERLKTFVGKITDALTKVTQLNGYYFIENDTAKSLGYDNDNIQIGLSAQEVESVFPEIVTEAPIDAKYKTIWYEKMVPVLIEAIKELKAEVDELKKRS